MKLVDRHILREYLIVMFYCLGGFTLIYVLLDLLAFLARFIEAQVSPWEIVRYYLCWLLPFLQYLIPASLLFATLYTLWRMARNNELTAMRAAGLSLARIMRPFLAVGLFFTLFVASIQETLIPRTSVWVEQFRSSALGKRAAAGTQPVVSPHYYDSQARQMWQVERMDPDHPRHLHGVKITEDRASGSRLRQITASRAHYLDGAWWLFDARVQMFNDDPFSTPDGPPRTLPAAGTEMRELRARPRDFLAEIRPLTMMSTSELARFIADQRQLSPTRRADARVVFHARFAMPWACVIVTLFAIPVGARNSRQNMLTGVFLAVVCFFSFYALIQIGFALGRQGVLWPWLGAWLSNAVFLVAGWAMNRRLE